MGNADISFVKTDRSVTVNHKGETFTALAGTPEYEQVVACLKARDWSGLPSAVSKALAINEYSGGVFSVKDGRLWVKGKMVPTALAQKILEFKSEGLPHEPLVRFAENLLENPSEHSVEQLFGFLEKNRHPITNDGYFIAYKTIRSDWKDVHSGTMDNSPGTKVSMDREGVDPDPNRTCSAGLHVANWEYPTQHFRGDRLIEVKVNPRDVVAVPNDYNNAKMRVSEYIVMGEIQAPRQELLTSYESDSDSKEEEDLDEDNEYDDESDDNDDYYG